MALEFRFWFKLDFSQFECDDVKDYSIPIPKCEIQQSPKVQKLCQMKSQNTVLNTTKIQQNLPSSLRLQKANQTPKGNVNVPRENRLDRKVSHERHVPESGKNIFKHPNLVNFMSVP